MGGKIYSSHIYIFRFTIGLHIHDCTTDLNFVLTRPLTVTSSYIPNFEVELYRESRGLYRETRGLYRETRGLYRETRGLYRETRGLYRETRGLYRETRGLFRQSVSFIQVYKV